MHEQLTLFPTEARPPAYVYVLWRPAANMFKIGTSCDPHRRARELAGRLLFHEPGGRKAERALHKLFAAYRVPGTEWFWPARAIWEWLAERDVDGQALSS
jgi:hypothetical protein